MVSICYVGFPCLDVVCDELCYCVESFVHIECYSNCSCRGAICLNPFAMVLFYVCSAVTVVCCVVLCIRVAWVWLICLLLCKEEGSSPVSLQILKGWMWTCMGYPCLCLCCDLGWELW